MKTRTSTFRIAGYIRGCAAAPDVTKQQRDLARAGVREDCVYADLAHGKRLAFERLLKVLHEGDIVIVASLDRLGTSVEEILGRLKEIRAKGAILSSLKEKIDGTKPSGRLTIETLTRLPEMGSVLAAERKVEIERRKSAPKRSPGRPGRVTQDLMAQADGLLGDGLTVGAAARKIGVGRSTLYKAFQEARV